MMAIAIAMETFFSTWGAWAEAGAAASMDTEARTASLAKRILELPLFFGALFNPRQRRLMRARRGISSDQVLRWKCCSDCRVAKAQACPPSGIRYRRWARRKSALPALWLGRR